LKALSVSDNTNNHLKPVSKDLKDLKSSTIEKIRRRERQLEEEAKAPVDMKKRILDLSRIPSLCDNIRSYPFLSRTFP
jgi:hypothetical protein